eukprot:SAG11_NODE_4317_length_1951_cov_4.851512_1_plen_71_part_00
MGTPARVPGYHDGSTPVHVLNLVPVNLVLATRVVLNLVTAWEDLLRLAVQVPHGAVPYPGTVPAYHQGTG